MWRGLYLPLALEISAAVAAALAAVALAMLLVTGPHLELLLVIAPMCAGIAGWLRTPKIARLRRGALLQAAIDQAPHRFERPPRPKHRLYGTLVEAEGGQVVVALVYREPGSKQVTILERRHHHGDELEAAAASVAATDDRAATLERAVRDRLRAEREAAERMRMRQAQEAEEARLRAIDETHARELAERDRELRTEDEHARRRDAEREAASLAKALRREP